MVRSWREADKILCDYIELPEDELLRKYYGNWKGRAPIQGKTVKRSERVAHLNPILFKSGCVASCCNPRLRRYR